MAGEIIWSPKAKSELIEILEYWVNRNKSNIYSLKINQLIQEQLIFILEFPKIGRKTDIKNVYVKIIRDYLLYYEIEKGNLHVLTIRHGKKNPKTLALK
jgi:toxin YoeB